jgi:putative glutathione S-transferase
VNNAHTIRELYELAGTHVNKYSVPVLWDKKLKTIVNNESAEVAEMLSKEFNEYAKNKELDLVPSDLVDKMKETESWVTEHIIWGVYKCAFT